MKPTQKSLGLRGGELSVTDTLVNKQKRSGIADVIYGALENIPTMTVEHSEDDITLTITNGYVHVPNWRLQWIEPVNRPPYYRVYIELSHREQGDETSRISASHSIAVIKNIMDAAKFVQTVTFFSDHRSNNKSSK